MCRFCSFVQVHDQEVIYKNVSIEGPNGIIRSGEKAGKSSTSSSANGSNKRDDTIEPRGYRYKGCFRDSTDRLFTFHSKNEKMTSGVRCMIPYEGRCNLSFNAGLA